MKTRFEYRIHWDYIDYDFIAMLFDFPLLWEGDNS